VNDLAPVARLIGALRPWLNGLVIVGGWAHRLYRFHPRAGAPGYLPLLTRDADIAFSLEAQFDGNIGTALREANFEEDFRGEHAPPVIHYRLGHEDQGFYAEFLAPLQGSGTKRDGTPDVTLSKAGVTAQKFASLRLAVNQSLDSTPRRPTRCAASGTRAS
jgi:Nucleotidyltransferase